MKFFDRNLYTRLLIWKKKQTRKPLIIRGARQVGKTTLIRQFSKEFRFFIPLNLERPEDARRFGEHKNSKDTIEQLFFEHNLNPADKETLLFIDEVQALPFVIKQVRYFQEDFPDLHIVLAGSLLEFALRQIPSFPVGRVEELVLHPLSFDEFLLAIGESAVHREYQNIPFSDFAYEKTTKLFQTYTVIGGMPEIVSEYAERLSLAGIRDIYASIWESYKSDFITYAGNLSQVNLMRYVINTAPYVRDRIVFNNFGGSEYRSREVSEVFRMLDLARIIYLVYPATSSEMPQIPNTSRRPRMQFLDTGLLNYASGIQTELMKMEDLSAYFKSFIYQHIATQELISIESSHHYRPVFWVKENAKMTSEIDLTFNWNNFLIPIEVKSGAKGRLKSLHEFMISAPHKLSIRLLNNKFSTESCITRTNNEFTLINLPVFLTSKIPQYLDYVSDDLMI